MTGRVVSLMGSFVILCTILMSCESEEIKQKKRDMRSYAMSNQAEQIKKLAATNPELVDFKSVADYSRTPLMYAAINGGSEACKALMELGANPNIADDGGSGMAPIHHAVWEKHTDTVRVLLENGADPNIKSTNGSTPLHFAVHQKHIEIIEMLLEYGADKYIADNYGKVPEEKIGSRDPRTDEIIKLFESY